MRSANVFVNKELAGKLTELDDRSYQFQYREGYAKDPRCGAISITLPKTTEVFQSPTIFPFFANLVTEGFNLRNQSYLQKIDELDAFSLLVSASGEDTIGSVSIKLEN